MSLLLSLPWALYHSVSPVTACRTLHRCQLILPSSSRAVISLVMFLIQFLVPLVITMLAYSHISYHLWGSEHIGAATQQQQGRGDCDTESHPYTRRLEASVPATPAR